MQQPTKDFLKDQLALAADEIIRGRLLVNAYSDTLDEYRALATDSTRFMQQGAIGLGVLGVLLIAVAAWLP